MSIASSCVSIKLNDSKKFIVSNVNLQLAQRNAARLYITGVPGCGKSDLMRQICAENGWGLVVRYISNLAIEQITGLPVKPTSGQEVEWTVPAIFNFKNMEYKPDNYVEGVTPVVLLLDDFHLCDRMMQKYMFQLLTYMGLNNYSLSKNTAIILAGNRSTDKAGALPIPAPVCNRMMFVEVRPDAEDWLKNFAMKNNVRGDICTFIHERGNSYLIHDPIETNAWASPRSWTYLGYQMDQFEKTFGHIDLEDLKVMAEGTIGKEASSDFIMYRELFAKWDFSKMITQDWKEVQNLINSEIQRNPTEVYAIVNAGAAWLISQYRNANKDAENPTLKKAVSFVYDIYAHLLISKCKSVNTKPLVVAGAKYIKTFQSDAEINKMRAEGKFSLIALLMNEITKKRNIDYIFYKIFAEIFNFKVDSETSKKIEKAEKELQNVAV